MFLINRRQMAGLAVWSVTASRAWAQAPLTPREQELYEAAKRATDPETGNPAPPEEEP